MQKLGHTQRLEEIAVTADIAESQALYRHDAQPSGVKWVDGLRSSVRPMTTSSGINGYGSSQRCEIRNPIHHHRSAT
jgi:hypothetical protein